MDTNEKMLFDVLRDTGCTELPEKSTGNERSPWVMAIGEAVKYDGSRSYVILRNIDGENYRISKDYGSSAKIVRMESIRPYMPLYATYTPLVKSKEDIADFIAGERWNRVNNISGDPEYHTKRIAFVEKEKAAIMEMDPHDIRREFYKYAIETQIVGIKARIADNSKLVAPPTEKDMVDIDGILVRKEVAEKVQQLKVYQNKINGKEANKEPEKPAEPAVAEKPAEVTPDAGNTQSDEAESKSVARRVRKVSRKN